MLAQSTVIDLKRSAIDGKPDMRLLIECIDHRELQLIADDLASAGLPDEIHATVRAGSEASFDLLIPPKGARWEISYADADNLLEAVREHAPRIIAISEQVLDRRRGPVVFEQALSDHLHRAGASLRVCRRIPGGISDSPRILLGYDGSNSSLRALRVLTDRRFAAGSAVRLVAAADSVLLSSIGRFVPQMGDSKVRKRFVSQWLDTMSADAVRRLSNAGYEVSVQSRMGEPVSVVLDEAKRFDADLILIGHHHQGPDDPACQPTDIAAEIARSSDRSVEIVF
jgi:nucleotide-binding universal stress UspA family protein